MRRRKLIPLFAGLGMALQARVEPDEEVWRHFLAWLRSARPAPEVLSLLAAYREAMVRAGFTESAAEARLLTVRRLMAVRGEAWPRMFDLIYADAAPGFRTAPSALLVQAVEGRKPGRALDIAMGQGRNSVFLAQRGWDAGGFDVSAKGLETARNAAERAGVAIRTQLASHDEFVLEPAQWDLIVLTYAPVPFTSAGYSRRIIESLRPRGLLVAESFAKAESAARATPVDIDPDLLLERYRSLRLLHFQDIVDTPDWGREPVRLIRFVAEKR